MNKPLFVTFTGVDDHTSIPGMVELANKYPIEWGVLFSPERQGAGRFPSAGFLSDFTRTPHELRLAAHVCGGYSAEVIAQGRNGLEELLKKHFMRVQINTASKSFDTAKLRFWADKIGLSAILQCRGDFPADTNVSWLFDTSGGRGTVPASWPAPSQSFCGYSGGIGPDNAAQIVQVIGLRADQYWIDMESGVRDEQDRFDLARCRAVCEAVYGAR